MHDILLFVLVMIVHLGAAGDTACAADAAYAFVVRPYVQLGDAPSLRPQEQMVILWHAANEEAKWKVEFRKSADSVWESTNSPSWNEVAVESAVPHRVYRGVIDCLEPGAEFQYRVQRNGDTVFSSSSRARRPRGQSHRCVVMGDCGTGSTGQKHVAHQVYKASPDYVVIPGDLVYNNGLIGEYKERFFPIYNSDEANPECGAPLLRTIPFFGGLGQHDTGEPLDRFSDGFAFYMYWSFPLNGPVRAIGGSHAFPLGGTKAMRTATLAATADRYPRMANYSFDYGDAHWTVLDTWNPHIDWNNAALRTWLKNDLASTDATWKFVSSYLPPFNSSTKFPHTQKMRVVADILQENGVDMVFSGYAHSFQVTYPLRFTAKPAAQGPVKDPGHVIPGDFEFDVVFDGKKQTRPHGVLYITTGGGGHPELHSPEQTDNPGTWQDFTVKYNASINQFTELHVEGRGVTLRQIDQNGQLIDQIQVTK